MKKHYSKLWILFKSMFVLSMCTFGGGFVIVSLMKKRFVEELKWIEEEDKIKKLDKKFKDDNVKDAKERARIPEQLCEHIVSLCE